MRVRIAAVVSQAVREVSRTTLEGWLNLRGPTFEHFIGEVCGWTVEGEVVKVPLNKENEAKGTVVRENVKFDREFSREDEAERYRWWLTGCCRVHESHTESVRAAGIRLINIEQMKMHGVPSMALEDGQGKTGLQEVS